MHLQTAVGVRGGVENRIFVRTSIEIFGNNWNGQKGDLGTRCPELALLTVPNVLENLYTKIRFSTPAHVGLRVRRAHCKKCRVNLESKRCVW